MGEMTDGIINGDFCQTCTGPCDDDFIFAHDCERCMVAKLADGNTPERIKQLKTIMDAHFGPEVTRGSLFRKLNKTTFIELYSQDEYDEARKAN